MRGNDSFEPRYQRNRGEYSRCPPFTQSLRFTLVKVISAFFFQGFLAALIGIYMYYVSGRWARLKSFPFLVYKHLLHTRCLRGIPSLVGEITPVNPQREAMMADMIVLTSDMQTLSGIALMVAALTQLGGLSVYHAILVGNIGWIPSQSHHLAIMYVWEARPHGRHQRMRYAAIAVYAVLYVVFCTLIYVDVRKRWNLESNCFIACQESSCVGGFVEQDAMLGWILVNLVLFVLSYVPILCNCMKYCFGRKYGWLRLLGDAMFSAFSSQVTMIFWTVFTLSGVDGYRKANRKLLNDQDAEEKWGFGQVIAVVSLLLVVFECWKAYASK